MKLVWIVQRALDGDEWKSVKAFSTNEAAQDYITTCAQVSSNVYWRTHTLPLDTIAPDEPYAVVKRVLQATKAELKHLLSAEAALANATRDAYGEHTAEVRLCRAAVDAAKTRYDERIQEGLKTASPEFSEHESMDSALLQL